MKISNEPEVTRTHDNFYENEDRSNQPKEYFKWLIELTKLQEVQSSSKMIDIGCASGDFIHYFAQNFPDAELNGLDVLENLVNAAKRKNPKATITQGNLNSSDFSSKTQYDLVYMSGVHSIFDDCTNWTSNFSKLLAKNSTGFIFGLFNPFPYDVLLKVRSSNSDGSFETGWNSFSCETVKKAFESNNCTCEFKPWKLPLTIEMNKSDPLRSWTIATKFDGNIVTNATRIIHDFQCAIIKKAS